MTRTPTPPSRTALAVGLALAALSAACAPTTPVFDREFGASVRAIAAQQTRDPDATRTNAGRPVDGIDGRAARESVDRYYRSFNEPPKTANPFVIGVSGQDSGGGGER